MSAPTERSTAEVPRASEVPRAGTSGDKEKQYRLIERSGEDLSALAVEGQEGEEEAGGAQGVARAEEAGKAGADEPATEEGPRSIL